ncbi:MAG TPA: hypothetical protein VK843_03135, partial [Planctomycetota bacterium]|nr:hypothetical protein [Planctomycetota bacterium]
KDAIEAYKRSETSYAGLAEKAKALKATLTAPVSNITKHVGQLDKFIFDLQATIKQQKASLAELALKARDAKSSEVDAAVKSAVANMDKASDQLKAIAECSKAAEEIRLAYSAQKLPDYGKLQTVVTKLGGAGDAVSLAGSSLKTCFQVLKDIGVPMPV